ncbi:TIGR00341 family protein [Halocatena pleomorpha]|uniref:TIGR00341 family protein n=1 Tax=Halocatena pleomorpha TaxID=1785090 RepID=A0A3P3RJR2_9EURY|nr:TIGR00341 family protein [Halocatena pleomorpha]RRJ33776.1 TIGR00341 family protein [Halocatena pleomorpha]
MRLVQLLVSDRQHDTVTDFLDSEGIDYIRRRVRTNEPDTTKWLIEFPVPTDAIGYVFDRLIDMGIDEEQYTTVISLEGASTPRSESLLDRFASDFDTLTRLELKSKARDISYDLRSFLVMIFLSAIVATVGLLMDSPAVVVGSMVIAPIIGPVMTATVGAATGDRKMLLHSLRNQALGFGVAILGAMLCSVGLQLGGIAPNSLDVSTVELISLRSAPNWFTALIGIASGAAGAFALTTKGSTSLVGVMIAAALIPAAATVGIAAMWGASRLAVGSLLLLVLTLLLINASAFAVLWWFQYRPQRQGWLVSADSGTWLVVVTGIVLIALTVLTAGAFYEQSSFEQTVNHEVETTLAAPEYASLEPVTVRTEYTGPGPFSSPETVTVVVSRTDGDSPPPEVAETLDRRITESTDETPIVRVRFDSYQYSNTSRVNVPSRPSPLGT